MSDLTSISIRSRMWAEAIIVILFVIVLRQPAIADGVPPCIPSSNYPNQITEVSWIPSASYQMIDAHLRLFRKMQHRKKIYLSDVDFPIAGHRLKRADSDALVYRQKFQGWPHLTDTSTIAYITITAPKPISGSHSLELGRDMSAIAFLTVGSKPFHNFCIGYATSGELQYTARGGADESITEKIFLDSVLSTIGSDGVLVHLSFQANLVDSKGGEAACGRCVFDGIFLAPKKQLSNFVDH